MQAQSQKQDLSICRWKKKKHTEYNTVFIPDQEEPSQRIPNMETASIKDKEDNMPVAHFQQYMRQWKKLKDNQNERKELISLHMLCNS